MSFKVLGFLAFFAALVAGAPSTNTRIFGGEEALSKEFPFVVALADAKSKNISAFCSGTILTSDWILTAAQCCSRNASDEFHILSGTANLNKGAKISKVAKTVIHPYYNVAEFENITNSNDVCLVQLLEPLVLSENTRPVVLPPADYPFADKTPVSVLGWGYESTSWGGEQESSNKLQVFRSLLAYPSSCPVDFTGAFVGQFCSESTYKGHSPCKNDEGSPLVFYGTKGPVQIGIYSFKQNKYCSDNLRSNYGRVAHYVPWIEAIIAEDLTIADYKELPCTGAIFPFIPVYAKVLGLSSSTVGTIFTVLPVLGLIFKPIFGAIADKFKWHRSVMLVWDFIVMAAYFAIYFIPVPPRGEDLYTSWEFWFFVFLLALTWIGTGIVTTIADTLIIETCGAELYGYQRVWGSIAWGVTSLVTGVLMDAVSEGETNYAPMFYLMLGPMILDIIISYKYMNVKMPAQSENITKDVWKVLIKPRSAVFTLWCGFQGVSFGLLWNFLYWHLEDLADAWGPDMSSQIKTIEGIVQGLQCFIGEGPTFFFSGWIISKLGHHHAFSAVFLCIGLRFVLYSVLVNPWWCIPIELFQNNYGLFYSAMTSYAKKVGPPGTEATIQSTLCAVCEGVGIAIGSLVAGLLYEEYGGSLTFRAFGITFLVLAIVNEILDFTFKQIERRRPPPEGIVEKVPGDI